MRTHRYDLVTVGRANMDLYSQDIGAAFEDITGFDATVGGSPTNIAIGTARLGLRSIAFTAVGNDRVGDFVVRYLRDAGVETRYIPHKEGKLTSLALLGVRPPSRANLSRRPRDVDAHDGQYVVQRGQSRFSRSKSALCASNGRGAEIL